MKKLLQLFIITLLLSCNYLLANDAPKSKWQSESNLKTKIDKMTESHFYPIKITGKLTGIQGSYQADFRPFPGNLNKFHSYWGMTTGFYEKHYEEFTGMGYIELSHSSFYDMGGNEIHQVVFIKYKN